ncbi:MAG: hypothetical protein ACOX9C_07250 [Kiritimatiellia bacterium]|jgi:hypothetical protein
MANPVKAAFIEELTSRFGPPRKLKNSESLFEVGRDAVRLYFRYSKRHPHNRTFFGLRKVDLQALEGHNGVLCFFWEGQREPLFVPFGQFEEVFAGLSPASDGQFKAQIYEQIEGTELYLANAGRFNVESYMGWDFLESMIQPSGITVPELNHSQVQTLLGGIGIAKGFDIWIPPNDRANLDWNLTPRFRPTPELPSALMAIKAIAEEIDVIWIDRGGGTPAALYEVEHSTPVYSGLLRFNDVHLVVPSLRLRFGIVSNDDRRALFVRQVGRPTFKASGLRDFCTFFEYRNVFGWHQRMRIGGQEHG